MLSLLGEGGMGVVYRAQQIALDREVAVKVLKSEGDEDEARFLREGRMLAALSCPQIVRVLDADAEAGRLWLVCELITGENLRVRHERAPLPAGQVLEVVLEVARALEVAHARGIVHRDVKPENVMLAGPRIVPGAVKLADFGLARDVASGEALTTSGMVLGTPHYIAPEQVRGLAAGPAADQYALGVMLYWLLTGAYPVDGPSALDIMMRKCTVVAPPAYHANARVSRALSTAIDRALAIEPGDRYGAVSEMAAELDRVRHLVGLGASGATRAVDPPQLADDPRAVTAPHPRPAPSPPPRRVAAVVAVLLTGIGLILLRHAWSSRRIARDEPPVRAPHITAAEIALTRVNGAPCLEIRTPVSTGLAVELVTPEGPVALTPVLGDPDALHYRVDPALIVQPVRFDLTAVDGARVTTSVVWPGLAAQVAEQTAVLQRARGLLESEHLRVLEGNALLGELPRLHSMWTRLMKPLREVAPAVLDHPLVPLDRKKLLYEALATLRVLDRVCRAAGYQPILPAGIFGRTFGADRAPGGLYFESSRKLSVVTPVEGVFNLGVSLPDAAPTLDLPPPPTPAARVMLEVEPGGLTDDELLWFSLNGWKILITSDNRVEPDGPCRQGLDPRIGGGEISAHFQSLPGVRSRNVHRALNRVSLRSIEH